MSNEWGQFGKKGKTTWTDRATVVYGGYKWLNDYPIHYCLTSLSVRNLWDDIKLMSEIPGSEKWGFEALFQRMIREEWVSQIVKNYLGNRDKLKFFPPITVALLPCVNDSPARKYETQDGFEFSKNDAGGHIAALPGLRILFPTADKPEFPVFGSPALLDWDKTKYVAVAIDGQHRISALRQYVPREGQRADSSDVPASILVFDPKVPGGRDLIQATREIFIDINKNAKTVDDSRLILLDDRNFYNCLTRSLILQAYPNGEAASEIKYEKVEAETDLEILSGIPQELIDTAAGRESADIAKLKNWQFTSAFILNRGVQYFAFEDKFERFEDLLETAGYSEQSEDELEKAVAQRRQEYEDGGDDEGGSISDHDMLSFKPGVTEKLVARALRMHRGLFLGVFTAFQPYKEHIVKFANSVNGDDGNDVRSLLLAEGSLPTRGGMEFTSRIALEIKADEPRFRRIKKTIEKLGRPKSWEKSLVWYSVFQRGLIYQPQFIRKAMEIGREQAYSSREEFAKEYIDTLNELFDGGYFDREYSLSSGSKRIWDGVALKMGASGESALDGSDGAAKRTGQLIRLMIMAVQARESGEYRHLKENISKQGIASAISAVRTGWIRYKKARDAAGGSLKDPEEYESYANKMMEGLLKSLSESEKI